MKSYLLGLFSGAAIVAGVLGARDLALFFLVALVVVGVLLDERIEVVELDRPSPRQEAREEVERLLP